MLEAISESGASSWLTSLPIAKYGFHLDKCSFQDALCLRYNFELHRLPLNCICGATYTTAHAISCTRGGFTIIRHNDIRDVTAEMLREVCHDVAAEPVLSPLSGESFICKTANLNEDARCDVSARGFWRKASKAFVDVRVFNPLAKSNFSKSLEVLYRGNEQAKKREYSERILQVEHGTFTPLVFSTFGGMGREATVFYKRLNAALAEKKNINESVCMSFIRTRLSFSLLRNLLMCLRGTRSKRAMSISDTDIPMAIVETEQKSG